MSVCGCVCTCLCAYVWVHVCLCVRVHTHVSGHVSTRVCSCCGGSGRWHTRGCWPLGHSSHMWVETPPRLCPVTAAPSVAQFPPGCDCHLAPDAPRPLQSLPNRQLPAWQTQPPADRPPGRDPALRQRDMSLPASTGKGPPWVAQAAEFPRGSWSGNQGLPPGQQRGAEGASSSPCSHLGPLRPRTAREVPRP